MEQFATGWKRNYYGKADVVVYRLERQADPEAEQLPVFGANVKLLVYGEAFWPTYTTGDNSQLVATDSMKNFIQQETLNYTGNDLDLYCRFLAERFLSTYPQTEGIQVSATEIPYSPVPLSDVAFRPSGPERVTARIEIQRSGAIVEATSGIRDFRLLRLHGSAFSGFVRDRYTTLPDIRNRPLYMWLDLEWRANVLGGRISSKVHELVYSTFGELQSESIQQLMYQMGTQILSHIPEIQELDLEANNRTWDTISEQGEELGIYTEPRPPYGCVGLRLKR